MKNIEKIREALMIMADSVCEQIELQDLSIIDAQIKLNCEQPGNAQYVVSKFDFDEESDND